MQDGLQLLIATRSRLQAAQYTIAAAVTVFIYDLLLTLNDEIELVWKHKLTSVASLLYLSNRYISLTGMIYITYTMSPFRPPLSESFCQSFAEYFLYAAGCASWAGIMTLRVGVLWRSNIIVVCLAWISCVGYVTFVLVSFVILYTNLRPMMEYDTTLGLCVPDTTNSPDSSFQTIGPALRAAFVTVLTILTAAKTYWYRTHLELFAASSLLGLLFRDGILYLFVVTGLSIATTLSWFLMEDASARLYFLIYLNWAIFSILVSRFFLRLRKLYHEQRQVSTIGTRNVTDLFASHPTRISLSMRTTLFQAEAPHGGPFGENESVLPTGDPVDTELQNLSDQEEPEPTADTRPVSLALRESDIEARQRPGESRINNSSPK